MNEQKPQENKNIQEMLQHYETNRKAKFASNDNQKSTSVFCSVLLVAAIIFYLLGLGIIIFSFTSPENLIGIICGLVMIPSGLILHALSKILSILENKQ